MGTTISLLLPSGQAVMGRQIVHALFTEWEQVLSRFLPESELSQLNQRAGKPMLVSDLLCTVLLTALAAAQATEGVYDPTLLDQLMRAGYDRNFDDLPLERCGRCAPGLPGGRWRDIQIDAMQHVVTLPAGLKLDFGGIAKGMAVDAALKQLQVHGIVPALVNAGGDLAVVGLPPTQGQWQISVPGRAQCWSVPLRSGAVATSGIARRHWLMDGKLRHHLIDPRSGQPAESDLWSVTVVADRCEQAEVAAKVAFILGSTRGAEFLRKHRIAGLLVHGDATWDAAEPWPKQLMEEINV